MATYNPPTQSYPIFDPSVFVNEATTTTTTPNLINGTLTVYSGANQNIITGSGYTTKNNEGETATHYLNMSNASAAGVGAIQKNQYLKFTPESGGGTLATDKITTTGVITAGGLITANGGFVMGGDNNIYLGNGNTAPTAGQLGYSYMVDVSSNTILTGTNANFVTGGILLPTISGTLVRGTFLFSYNVNFSLPVSTSNGSIFVSVVSISAVGVVTEVLGSKGMICVPPTSVSTYTTTATGAFFFNNNGTIIDKLYLYIYATNFSGTLPSTTTDGKVSYVRIS